ncbi:hypothetical protein [Adhaeretor mobilis]|uniref:Uncharacterized protein n=1 Tax=Adhaeretor mobilis TaxID=1930276 RepID=A0A517MXB3_9BACT|nr:hypothetical protein [Adhaeretor mobilis]QDS99520.1 hypothetical protein HG15A2_28440 [Adhaeretor mobilis]
MLNRVFISSTVVLWLGSMSWLVVDKILPSFYESDLPMAAGLSPDLPVAWEVQWSGRRVGHAVSLMREGVQGTTEVHNRIILDNVPMLELAPAWMQSAVRELGSLKFSAKTRLEFDSLDNFTAFESSVAINDVTGIVKISGRMKESKMQLKIQAGDFPYTDEIQIPDQAALNESLFPDARLPYMYVGRHWQEDVYNPFGNPKEPIDRVDAEVMAAEFLEHAGERKRVMRVDYHTSSSAGVSDRARLRAKTWVEPDGLVLKQVVYLSNAQLCFTRLADDEVHDLVNDFFPILMNEIRLRKELSGGKKAALP